MTIYSMLGNALNSAIWCLHCRNPKYGTGYDLEIKDEEVTLYLMSGPSSERDITMRLTATSKKSGYAFVEEISTILQNQLFTLQKDNQEC